MYLRVWHETKNSMVLKPERTQDFKKQIWEMKMNLLRIFETRWWNMKISRKMVSELKVVMINRKIIEWKNGFRVWKTNII